MAEVVLNFVNPLIEHAISKAISFAGARISLAWGLKKELKELAERLIFIKGVLQAAEERQESNQAVRIWLQQLNDVAYEAVDALDEYAYEVLKHKVQSQGRRREQKDCVIGKNDLIQLWMAQGFLHKSTSLATMEDIGNHYFNELSNCLFQDIECDFCNIDENSTIQHLRVEYDGEVLPTIPRSIAQRLHSLFSNVDVFCSMALDLRNLRFLKLLKGGKKIELTPSLNKLKHLRYLDASETSVKLEAYIFLSPILCLYSTVNFPSNIIKILCGYKKGIWVEEIGCLNQLRGELAISHLDCARSKFEASKANLREKKLYKLEFTWNVDRKGNINDEEVIESLEPHSNLKSLTIENYRGKNFPSWLVRSIGCSGSSFLLNNLVELKLLHCYECTCIPSLGLLPSLKVLHIDYMTQVRKMGHKLYVRNQSTGVESITLFPALKKLKMWHLKKLEEWVEVDEDTAAGGEVEIVFPGLEELVIFDCPELKIWSMGGFSSNHKLSNLSIWECPNLMVIPNIDGLSSLKRIELGGCKELPTGLGSCISLQELIIYNVPNLISIPEDVGILHSLTSLTIQNCDKLRIQEFLGGLTISLKELRVGPFCRDLEEFPLPRLNSIASLESLALWGWDKLKSLPHQLQHLTALKKLEIYSFKGVEALPEWLGNLSSIRRLEIRYCPNLMCLPSLEAMGRLSNLQLLYAWDCPKLVERCANKSGFEWSKISHIPNIIIGDIEQGEPWRC
ncbi:hypothetical protein SLEP1_g27820 [Rubroshorea leprosula]|uniref:Rx N-terminal domain-containing protein n=1 Tax=Rubroshorea leprosula TaxID=152421 RepID=A0AAV5K2E6_9ROSI|nr:hypothetical protein SLEP1_g27820 [Rubroshorea leprosula]